MPFNMMYNFMPFSLQDSPSSCAIIFYNKCNMRCKYCYNHNLWTTNHGFSFKGMIQKIDFLKDYNPKLDSDFLKVEYLILSGGECLYPDLFQFIRTIKILKKAKKIGLKTGIYTNGLTPVYIKILISLHLLDFVNIDYKVIPDDLSIINNNKVLNYESNIEKSIKICDKAFKKSQISYFRLNTVLLRTVHDILYLQKMKQYLRMIGATPDIKLSKDILSSDHYVWVLTPVQSRESFEDMSNNEFSIVEQELLIKGLKND